MHGTAAGVPGMADRSGPAGGTSRGHCHRPAPGTGYRAQPSQPGHQHQPLKVYSGAFELKVSDRITKGVLMLLLIAAPLRLAPKIKSVAAFEIGPLVPTPLPAVAQVWLTPPFHV